MAEVVVVSGDWTTVDIQFFTVVVGGSHQAQHFAFRLIESIEGLLVQTAPFNVEPLRSTYGVAHTLPPAPYTAFACHGYTSKSSFP
jgi:hypothetical protein